MKILHTADWHLGKSLEGISRYEEQKAFMEDFIQMVVEEQADLVLIAGDVYDSVNPPAWAENLLYDGLKRISGDGERMVVVIAGNHDSPDRLTAAAPLAGKHGIILCGLPGQTISVGTYGDHQVTESAPGYIRVHIGEEEAQILLLPYPSEKRLNEVLFSSEMGEAERAESYGRKVKELFETMSGYYTEDAIHLVVAHLFTMGSEEGGSERNIQLGGSYLVDGSYLPKEAQYIALGHIHKPQKVPGTEGKARYSGSPIHYHKNEIAHDKKVILVEVETGKEAVITEKKIPVYKPIQIWNMPSITAALEECEKRKDENSYVYLEIQTDRYIREDEIKEMKSRKKDILSIMPVIENTEEEWKAEDTSELSMAEMFRRFYEKEKEISPDEELMELLFSLTGEEE